MKSKDLMAKAVQASASAKVLLGTGDADGACNRAYYAMFDAPVPLYWRRGRRLARRTKVS